MDYILEREEMAMIKTKFWNDGEYYLQRRCVAMGAKYVPSVANIFMTKWEEKTIYGRN